MLRESLLTNACIPLVLQYFFPSSLCMLCMVKLPCFCTFLAVLIQLMVYFLYLCLMQGSKNVALFVFLGWHGLVKFCVFQCKISTTSPPKPYIQQIGSTLYLLIGTKVLEIKPMGTLHLCYVVSKDFQKNGITASWMPVKDTGMQLTEFVFKEKLVL